MKNKFKITSQPLMGSTVFNVYFGIVKLKQFETKEEAKTYIADICRRLES